MGANSHGAIQAILNSLPAMAGYWDSDLRNQMANDAYVAFFGKSPAEIEGTHIRDLLGPELYEQNLPYIEGALAGERQLFDREITTPSGEVRYTQASYIPDEADGVVRGFFVLVTDITDRHRAETALAESEARNRTLVDHLPNMAVSLVDPDLRLSWLGGGTVADADLDVEGMIGRPVRETSGGGEHGRLIESLYRRALDGEKISTEVHSHVTRRDFGVEIVPLIDPDGQVSGALGVAQDITERLEREAEERAISAIATLVAEGTEPIRVFTAVAEQLGILLGARAAAVTRFLVEDKQGSVAGGWPDSGTDLAGATFDLDGATASARVFQTQKCARVDSLKVDAGDPAARTVEDFTIEGAIATPILVAGRLWGTIGAAFGGRGVPDNAERRLDRFAPLVALAVANADAMEELEQQANHDALTGLANRRLFESRLESEWARAERYGRDLSLVLFDLDHFKSVNDRHGHATGDSVLADFARRLKGETRRDGLVARMGGEEFAWLVPEASGDSAASAAERVRRAIEDEPFEPAGKVTVSAGVSSNEGIDDPARLLDNADRALYSAKEAGRNRTVRYE